MEYVCDLRIERREFGRLLFKTVFPLTLQSLFMQGINFISQVLVSSLGVEAVAAVGAANKCLTLFNSFLYGSCSGCAIFLAQYWGNRNIKAFKQILGITFTATVSVGSIFTFFVLISAEPLMRLFNTDPVVVSLGARYIRFTVIGYLLMTIVYPLEFALRSMGQVQIVMISTFLSVIVNCVGSYVLILGRWGFPSIGVTGAAIATIVTRIVEFFILLCIFRLTGNPVFHKIREMFTYSKQQVQSFLPKAIPLIVNEMMWSLGTTIYFIVYGRAGTEALATMSIMQVIQMLTKLLVGGFSGASAIIVGNEIGAGDIGKVQRYCKRFHKTALLVGIISGVVCLAAINPVLSIYGIKNTVVGKYVHQCMIITSVYVLLNSCNSINVEGIFRSGGDVRYVTLMDTGSIWLIGMPFTILTGLVFQLDISIVYMAYIVLELYKLPLGYWRFRSGKWLHRLM